MVSMGLFLGFHGLFTVAVSSRLLPSLKYYIFSLFVSLSILCCQGCPGYALEFEGCSLGEYRDELASLQSVHCTTLYNTLQHFVTLYNTVNTLHHSKTL